MIFTIAINGAAISWDKCPREDCAFICIKQDRATGEFAFRGTGVRLVSLTGRDYIINERYIASVIKRNLHSRYSFIKPARMYAARPFVLLTDYAGFYDSSRSNCMFLLCICSTALHFAVTYI